MEIERQDAVQRALEAVPDVMAALMREFMEKKDVESRALIRIRMKALLDFVSIDTVFPANPALDKTSRPGPARMAAMQDPYAAQGMVGGLDVPALPAPARINNGDLLP